MITKSSGHQMVWQGHVETVGNSNRLARTAGIENSSDSLSMGLLAEHAEAEFQLESFGRQELGSRKATADLKNKGREYRQIQWMILKVIRTRAELLINGETFRKKPDWHLELE